MARLRVFLFGRFRVARDAEPLGGLDGRKVQELLSYLLLHPRRQHSREALATLLWSDSAPAQSRKNLRQGLWQLQTALRADAAQHEAPALLLEQEWVRVNAEAEIWSDVADFERAVSAGRGVPGEALLAEQVAMLQHGIELYQGDLLDGWYQDWCLFERERLQNSYLALLDKLMAYCEAHDEYERGLDYGDRILSFDTARERTHQRLMRLYYLSGDRARALRQYQSCQDALRRELDVSPSRQTQQLHAQIVADRLTAPPAGAAPASPTQLADVLGRLKRVHGVLDDAQRRVALEIEGVEDLLRPDDARPHG
jgi:DNA-binding SARP family transcriptional activator